MINLKQFANFAQQIATKLFKDSVKKAKNSLLREELTKIGTHLIQFSNEEYKTVSLLLYQDTDTKIAFALYRSSETTKEFIFDSWICTEEINENKLLKNNAKTVKMLFEFRKRVIAEYDDLFQDNVLEMIVNSSKTMFEEKQLLRSIGV